MMAPRALILSGTGVVLAALALVAAAVVVRGPLNPACPGSCSLAARGLMALALPVAVLGGVLVAMGLARREPDRAE